MKRRAARASVPPPDPVVTSDLQRATEHQQPVEPSEVLEPSLTPIDVGVAGSSARAEHARRKANRQARNQQKLGKPLASAVEFLREPPKHETSWAKGAVGEEKFAALLAKRCNDSVIVLHDRRVPGSRANIDHIAICPTGVWVIDPKVYKGRILLRRPLFGENKLMIGGRDRTKLVDGVKRQLEIVGGVLAEEHPGVPVRGALVFPDGDMPMRGLPDFDGIKLTWPKRMAKALNQPGKLDAATIDAVARVLAERLPAKQ